MTDRSNWHGWDCVCDGHGWQPPMDDNDLCTNVVGFAEIIHVPPPDDGLRHEWTCPKAMPLLRTGECNCQPAPRGEQADGR
jgi:hypothetical protein